MEYAYLGGTGLKVSRLTLGTMNFGGAAASQCDEATAHAILDAYVAAGGNFIDTADIYAKGESERIVGRWLAAPANRELRKRLVLSTKVRFTADPASAGPNDVGLSRAHILRGLDESLERLGQAHVDVYLAHAWDEGTPLEETLRALDDCVRGGKATYTGWCNVAGWQIAKIVAESRRLGIAPPAMLQAQYSLLCREVEWELAEACASEGVALVPWSPLKGGWLAGRVSREGGAAPGSRIAWAEETGSKLQSHPGFSRFKEEERVWRLIDGVAAVAKEAAATPAQVSLRWLLAKRNVPTVVIGPKTPAQLAENMHALTIAPLTAAQVAALDALSDVPVPYPYEMIKRVNAARAR